MKLRTRLDLFSAALLSALGATQLVACGGSAAFSGGDPAGTGGDAPGKAGASGAGNGSSAGASSAGSGQSGANTGGTSTGGTSTGGTSTGGTSAAGSGESGAGSAGTGADAGAGSATNRYPCMNPRESEGFVSCDHFRHRQSVETCSSTVPRPDPVANPDPSSLCKSDADCTEKPYGWCGRNIGDQAPGSYCTYGCVKDSDCGANRLCECGSPVGRCVPTTCASDASCQSGFLCRSYDSTGGCLQTRYSCQSPEDSCGSDLDCAGGTAREYCMLDTVAQRFKCVQTACAIGRPFLVDGLERLAPVSARADWSELALLPRLAELDGALSSHLAERWTQIALMEHASIAAFARFTLQLMSLGAPASLLERATAAMVDETKHAKACFAIASGYAGAPLGPGPLDMANSLDDSSLEAIVLNTIREGCVGETVAAIEAREAAEHATDPALRELLLVIAEDETRHAELAYRFVHWALAAGGPELEHAVQREFAALAAEAAAAGDALTARDQTLLAHGIVPAALRAAIRQQAISEVILPCSRALVAPASRAPEARPAHLAQASA